MLLRMTVVGGGLGFILIAAAMSTEGYPSVVLCLAGIVSVFFGVGGIFLGAFFAFGSLLERLGILAPSQLGGGEYWPGAPARSSASACRDNTVNRCFIC